MHLLLTHCNFKLRNRQRLLYRSTASPSAILSIPVCSDLSNRFQISQIYCTKPQNPKLVWQIDYARSALSCQNGVYSLNVLFVFSQLGPITTQILHLHLLLHNMQVVLLSLTITKMIINEK